MAKDLKADLTKRLIDAIKKSFKPCPIIGDKWFVFHEGPPASLKFMGFRRLAKATGKKAPIVAKILLKHLELRGSGAEAKVSEAGQIRLVVKPPKASE